MKLKTKATACFSVVFKVFFLLQRAVPTKRRFSRWTAFECWNCADHASTSTYHGTLQSHLNWVWALVREARFEQSTLGCEETFKDAIVSGRALLM